MGNTKDESEEAQPAKAPSSTPTPSEPNLESIAPPDVEFLEQITSDLVADTSDALELLRESEEAEEEGISLAEINQEEKP